MTKDNNAYLPSPTILQKYADLLIKFALNSGKGIRKGEVVNVNVPECAKQFIPFLRRSIMTSGGHMMLHYTPDDVRSADFYKLASEEQLKFFPDKYTRGWVDQVDHTVSILSEHDPYKLKGVDSVKIMKVRSAHKPARDWMDAKENKGKFTWTLGLFGTEAMAKEANMSLKEYWGQIIRACYLDKADPIAEWKKITTEVERVKDKLNQLKIEKLHMEGDGIDLWIKIGSNRQWMGGGGRNIPSFEVFVSPDWRGTEGHVSFNEPLYRYSNKIDGIKLEFVKGRVVKATAKTNQKLLRDMIAVKGADKLGEYSLTDGRLSRINKFMAETLYDENRGGPQGNTHMALGMSFKDSYIGDINKVSDKKWAEMGFNDSAIHTDIISTARRKVTAFLPDGSAQIIYRHGKFQI